MIDMQPVYLHSCLDCIFLCHFEDADLYFCPTSRVIISRVSATAEPVTAASTFPIKRLMEGDWGMEHLVFRIGYLVAADRGLLPWCTNDLYIPAMSRMLEMSKQFRDHYHSRRVSARVREVIGKLVSLSEKVVLQRQLEPSCMED